MEPPPSTELGPVELGRSRPQGGNGPRESLPFADVTSDTHILKRLWRASRIYAARGRVGGPPNRRLLGICRAPECPMSGKEVLKQW
jgi:hypothetical protein